MADLYKYNGRKVVTCFTLKIKVFSTTNPSNFYNKIFVDCFFPPVHSGTFDKFYYCLTFAYDKEKLVKSRRLKKFVLLSFDEFFFDILANVEQ